MMWLQVWTLCAILIAATPLTAGLTSEADLKHPSTTFRAITDHTAVSNRFLRLGNDFKTGVEKANNMENAGEDRRLSLGIRFSGNTMKSVHQKLYDIVKTFAGTKKADKFMVMIAESVHLPALYKRGVRPSFFKERARLQKDPHLQKLDEHSAEMFTAWMKKRSLP
ncbi:RxLR effector protein [Phytophthora megakarya]|uniref:RxLR effector protein n=1 Tax=Phytophthora megakarya TaxID=4795 RepID=A0A225VFR0_9STRA|nr:RxLR effector protein [Phytophthora megakarya]